MPDEVSLAGKGRDILLPKHGNPFQQSVDASADPAADFAARNPSSHDDRNVLPNSVDPLPDLAPSDVANLFRDSGAAASSSAATTPMAASPTSPAYEIHRAPSMSSTEDPDTKVFEGSWLQAPSDITATGHEEALPAHDADDVIPAVGILSAPKPVTPAPTAPQSEPKKDDPFFSLFPNLKTEPVAQPASTPAQPSATPATSTSSSLRLPPLATSPVSSTPAPSATMTPSTSTPKSDSPSTTAPSLSDRLTPPASVSAPTKPADAGFKPANPFADSKPVPPPVSAVATDSDDDAGDALVNFAPGSSPAQPTPASPTTSRISFSSLNDPFSSSSSSSNSFGNVNLPMPPVSEQSDMVKMLVTDERLEQLWKRIDDTERRIIIDNNLGPSERTKSMDNIRGARNLMLGGRANYEDALRYVTEVESDLTEVSRLRSWSLTYGSVLFIYNMIWLVVLAILWASVGSILKSFGKTDIDTPFFITILCGGLGGVTGALRSMWVHISKDRDFDPQHLWWYLINPILGSVLSIFAYWVAQLGLVTMSGGSGAGATGNGVFVLYVLGWLVGFQQNVAYQLVEQAIKMIFKREDSSSKTSTAAAGGGTKPTTPAPDMKPKP